MNCLPGKVAICDDDKLLIGSSAGSPENPDDTLKVRRFHCAGKAVEARAGAKPSRDDTPRRGVAVLRRDADQPWR